MRVSVGIQGPATCPCDKPIVATDCCGTHPPGRKCIWTMTFKAPSDGVEISFRAYIGVGGKSLSARLGDHLRPMVNRLSLKHHLIDVKVVMCACRGPTNPCGNGITRISLKIGVTISLGLKSLKSPLPAWASFCAAANEQIPQARHARTRTFLLIDFIRKFHSDRPVTGAYIPECPARNA